MFHKIQRKKVQAKETKKKVEKETKRKRKTISRVPFVCFVSDLTTGSLSYEPQKQHNMESTSKGLYGILYKISKKVDRSENFK